MKRALSEALVAAGAPPSEFWENELEMGLEHVCAMLQEEDRMTAWVDKRKGNQAKVLLKSLGIPPGASTRKNKEALHSCDGQLLQYALVDYFGKRKSRQAVIDVASRVLQPEESDECRAGEDYDVKSLLYALYRRDPMSLRAVFHLDKMHKCGFARMVLDKNIRRPDQPLAEFLSAALVKNVLREYDAERTDGRSSELKDVHVDAERCTIFIRRAERPEMIVGPSGVQHGYRPEWIILSFHDGGKRVWIASVSVAVPLQIANRLAQAYFKQPREYLNESQVVTNKQLERLFGLLRDGAIDDLALVELTVASSPLEGQPKLTITGAEGIGNAIAQFERQVGGLLSNVDHIEAFRVAYSTKRVHLKLESLENVEDGFVVRYSDGKLNAKERKQFEEYMEKEHGIIALSTEKRFK